MRTTGPRVLDQASWDERRRTARAMRNKANTKQVHPNDQKCCRQPINTIRPGVSTGQLHLWTCAHSRCAGSMALQKLKRWMRKAWEHENGASYHSYHPNAGNDGVQWGQWYSGVGGKWPVIKGCGQQHSGFHHAESMNEEHLCARLQRQTGVSSWGWPAAWELWGERGSQVNGWKHTQEQVHRLVQGWFSGNDHQDGYVPPTTVTVPRRHTGVKATGGTVPDLGCPWVWKQESQEVWLGDSMVWPRVLGNFLGQKPSYSMTSPKETTQNRRGYESARATFLFLTPHLYLTEYKRVNSPIA